MTFILKFMMLLWVMQGVLSRYKAWDDIAETYTTLTWDEDLSESLLSKFENDCLELTNSTEGVCYDDCMLRSSYGIIKLLDKTVFDVISYVGWKTFETKIMNPEMDRGELLSDKVVVRIANCPIDFPLYINFDETRVENFGSLEEYEKQLCVKVLTEEEKIKLSKLIDCVKKNIPDWDNGNMCKYSEILSCIFNDHKKCLDDV